MKFVMKVFWQVVDKGKIKSRQTHKNHVISKLNALFKRSEKNLMDARAYSKAMPKISMNFVKPFSNGKYRKNYRILSVHTIFERLNQSP